MSTSDWHGLYQLGFEFAKTPLLIFNMFTCDFNRNLYFSHIILMVFANMIVNISYYQVLLQGE